MRRPRLLETGNGKLPSSSSRSICGELQLCESHQRNSIPVVDFQPASATPSTACCEPNLVIKQCLSR